MGAGRRDCSARLNHHRQSIQKKKPLALMPMARGTLSSIESLGIAKGMPGPVSRGDVASVEKHLAALAALGPEMLGFYRTLCASTVPLAVKSGAIDAATAQHLASVLHAKSVAG